MANEPRIPDCGKDGEISLERIDHLVDNAVAMMGLEGHTFTDADKDEIRADLMAKLASGAIDQPA